jgi:NodT family efflux transporter outer membrane factor (OMF) lipoprotein
MPVAPRLQSAPNILLHRTMPRRVMMAGAALAVTGCAVGPNYVRPADTPVARQFAPAPLTDTTAGAAGIAGGDREHFVLGRDIAFAWWKEFGSPRLDALVDKALANNPTLTAADAALKAAHEQTAAQRGFFYPTVGAEFTPTRQKIAGNLSSNDPGQQGNGNVLSVSPPQGLVYSFYTAQVGLSYTPDVFGANRRSVESLKAQEQATRYQMEAAYIALTTNVVAAALQEASLNAQIHASEAYIAANRKALDILLEQQRQGFVMALDVAQQESALAAAQATLPPLHRQLEQTHDLIRALVGTTPDDPIDVTFDLDSFHLPHELPLSVPARLLDQRPDVRAAEEALHSASAQVGVATAARLPQFTITAAYGGAASEVGQLFSSGGPFWNIIGDITQTIFDGGTLLHRKHAADQLLVQARAQYKSTVINAFQNVADTLQAIHADADGLVAADAAERAARKARDVTNDQYKAGYVNYQTLLAAEGMWQQALANRVQAQTNRFGDAAALYLALGGGWWNRTAQAGPDAPAKTPG